MSLNFLILYPYFPLTNIIGVSLPTLELALTLSNDNYLLHPIPTKLTKLIKRKEERKKEEEEENKKDKRKEEKKKEKKERKKTRLQAKRDQTKSQGQRSLCAVSVQQDRANRTGALEKIHRYPFSKTQTFLFLCSSAF